MSRAIDADRLLTDRMKKHYYHLPNGDIAIPIIDIEHAPTIEPERKRGRWIEARDEDPFYYICSECGHGHDFKDPYCPGCGAEMQEEEG